MFTCNHQWQCLRICNIAWGYRHFGCYIKVNNGNIFFKVFSLNVNFILTERLKLTSTEIVSWLVTEYVLYSQNRLKSNWLKSMENTLHSQNDLSFVSSVKFMMQTNLAGIWNEDKAKLTTMYIDDKIKASRRSLWKKIQNNRNMVKHRFIRPKLSFFRPEIDAFVNLLGTSFYFYFLSY